MLNGPGRPALTGHIARVGPPAKGARVAVWKLSSLPEITKRLGEKWGLINRSVVDPRGKNAGRPIGSWWCHTARKRAVHVPAPPWQYPRINGEYHE